jgi:hypothetical protein
MNETGSPQEEKMCTGTCREIKPLSDFHKSVGSRDGRQSACIVCMKARLKPLPLSSRHLYCLRGGGATMLRSDCLRGSSDACIQCPHMKDKSLTIVPVPSITPEQEELTKYSSKSYMGSEDYERDSSYA